MGIEDGRCRVDMLGRLRARRRDRVVEHFRTHKTGALLAYLAYHSERDHPREVLIELLWPGTSPDSGRNNLSRELSALRGAIEPPDQPDPPVILADRHAVRVDPAAITTDVAAFRAALARADGAPSPGERVGCLDAAVRVYGGELLPGHFQDWVQPERERLVEQVVRALHELVGFARASGDLPRALDLAQRALAADPLREESYRGLMVLYAETGEPAVALRLFRRLKTVLAEELDLDPAPVTLRLAQEIARGAAITDLGPAFDSPPDLRRDPSRDVARDAAGEPSRNIAQDTASEPSRGVTRDSARDPSRDVAQDAIDDPSHAAVRDTTRTPDRKEEPAPPVEPATAPVDARPIEARLPLPLTRCFGREAELAQLSESLIDGHARLITLTGPPGSGKTRLAIELARALDAPLRGAVWFLPLAGLQDVGLLGEAVADTLRAPRSDGRAAPDAIAALLADRTGLLVLDNFEHLIGEGGDLVLALVRRSVGLRCLVSSRHRLGVAGEREFQVRPLPLPEGPATPERVGAAPSVRLFVDRAQAVQARFALSETNAADVAAICTRLEGLPLAIELAAAWAHVLTPRQMLDRLGRPFDLLAERRPSETSRHRTLREALDWSYHLLTPDLRAFFDKLSIFHGGWTLVAAESVCDEPLALDGLARLLDSSLIMAQEQGAEMRYRLLQPVREYAAAHLDAESLAELRRRHLVTYTELAETAQARLGGSEQTRWLETLEAEHDNLRAALDFAAEAADPEAGLRLCGELWRFWYTRGHFAEGRAYVTRFLDRAGGAEPSAVHAQALKAGGILARAQGELDEAARLFEASLAEWRRLDHPRGISSALNNCGMVAQLQGDLDRALACYAESIAIKRKTGDLPGAAVTLYNQALIAHAQADYIQSRALCRESLDLYRRLGDRLGIARAFLHDGTCAESLGDYDLAAAQYKACLTIQRGQGNRQGVAQSLRFLGQLALLRQDPAGARPLLEEALSIARELGDPNGVGNALRFLGRLACEEGDFDAAELCLQESVILLDENGERAGLSDALDAQGRVALDRGDARAARARLTESLRLRDQIHYVVPLIQSTESFAALAAVEGRREDAVALAATAAAAREAIGAPIAPSERAEFDRRLAALSLTLDALADDPAWAQGRGRPLGDAVAQVLAVRA